MGAACVLVCTNALILTCRYQPSAVPRFGLVIFVGPCLCTLSFAAPAGLREVIAGRYTCSSIKFSYGPVRITFRANEHGALTGEEQQAVLHLVVLGCSWDRTFCSGLRIKVNNRPCPRTWVRRAVIRNYRVSRSSRSPGRNDVAVWWDVSKSLCSALTGSVI
jgi:hypothetical protein